MRAQEPQLYQVLQAALQQSGLRHIAVACSGGMDSVALLAGLAQCRQQFPDLRLRCLHLNFGLRGDESDGDEEFVRAMAERFDIPVVVKRLPTGAVDERGSESVQEWARRVRYEWFASVRGAGEWIALGHHKDDWIETILFRMLRATHIGQVVGMSECYAGFWRPFLSLTRDNIALWVTRQELPYRHDSSNDKLIYVRNILRHKTIPDLTPVFPMLGDNLIQVARQMADFSQFAQEQLRQQFKDAQTLAAEDILRLPRTVAYEALAQWLEARGEEKKSKDLLLTIFDHMSSRRNGGWETPHGHLVKLTNGRLFFHVRPQNVASHINN